MTDKELLELAAKAAGIYVLDPTGDDDLWADGARKCTDEYGCEQVEPQGFRVLSGIWNPLTDDSDALRLAVKLRIVINHIEVKPATFCYCDYRDPVTEDVVEDHGDDPYAATRRAIVRIAAEIGKGMK